jgi:hypothetical protein
MPAPLRVLFIGHQQNPRVQQLLGRGVAVARQGLQAVALFRGEDYLKLAYLLHLFLSFGRQFPRNLSLAPTAYNAQF